MKHGIPLAAIPTSFARGSAMLKADHSKLRRVHRAQRQPEAKVIGADGYDIDVLRSFFRRKLSDTDDSRKSPEPDLKAQTAEE